MCLDGAQVPLREHCLKLNKCVRQAVSSQSLNDHLGSIWLIPTTTTNTSRARPSDWTEGRGHLATERSWVSSSWNHSAIPLLRVFFLRTPTKPLVLLTTLTFLLYLTSYIRNRLFLGMLWISIAFNTSSTYLNSKYIYLCQFH